MAVHSDNYSDVIADNVWTPAGRIRGAIHRLVNVLSSFLSSSRVLSVDADVGWRAARQESEVSTFERTSSRRRGRRREGVLAAAGRPTAVVLINNFV